MQIFDSFESFLHFFIFTSNQMNESTVENSNLEANYCDILYSVYIFDDRYSKYIGWYDRAPQNPPTETSSPNV